MVSTTTNPTAFIREEALNLGFDACGFAKAEALPMEEQKQFQSWLGSNCHAGMAYLERNFESRMNPTLLEPGCKSVVVVALNYYPLQERSEHLPGIARYAYGQDYHTIVRGKLRQLLLRMDSAGLDARGRVFADSAPVMERYWAWKAGLGWRGRNGLIQIPGRGSYFFLGILLTPMELTPDTPMECRCGTCRRCIEHCPTSALTETHLDASRCLSYLSIEKKGGFEVSELDLIKKSNWVFGCDRCQEVCPWNRFAEPHQTPELIPPEEFLSLDRSQLKRLSPKAFNTHFKGTCMERAGHEGLMRNLQATD